MFYRYVLSILTLVAVIFGIALSVQKSGISYSCSGEYSVDINYSGVRIKSQINMMSIASRSHKLYVSYDGYVNFNDKSYHLNRELTFLYEILDQKAGLIRITPFSQRKNMSDTLDSKEVESLLLGVEKEGRVIRIWRLSKRTILVGIPYAPLYSCVLLGN